MVLLAATFGALSAPAFPTSAAPQLPASGAQQDPPFAPHVREAASRFGLPEAWLIAVMRVESAGNPRARSAVGAIGLMQVMPATWSELAARHQLGTDPWDARANVLAGAAYLREMVERYGDLETALAAYNAGPARADAWRRSARALPAETVHYVAKVLHLLGRETVPGTGYAPAAAVRPDWRHAPIFTARAGAEPAGPLPAIGTVPPANAQGQDAEPWPSSAAALPAERLFVGLSPASR
jgi:hypothetical protein